MSFSSFLAELKRRRVFRVAGVYALAAWGAMQVADLVLPRLGAPDWTVTLVVVLAIIGLPVVIALAWAFDITPDGLQRTPPREVQPTALPMRPHRALWFVAGILIALSIGWFAVTRDNTKDAGVLDPQLIAVLPFRVGGAEPSLGYLREGMLDLLAATLITDNGTRAVDPPTVLTHWKRAVASPTDDLPADSARRFARALHAGQLLTGSIIGTAASITMNLELTDVGSGKIHKLSVTGSADNLMQLVERVTGDLLAYAAGEVEERASLLAGVPLPAVRAYLEGQRALRSGRYDEAGRHFRDALRTDSMFVLAAIGFYTADSWIPWEDQGAVARARDLAWSHKDRLPSADRAIMLAILGPHYPKPSSGVEHIAAAREAVRIAPERPESYYALGDRLFHLGMAVGIENARDEAEQMFLRALAIDSSLFSPIEHLAHMAFARRDTAAVVRWANAGLRIDSIGGVAEVLRFLRAIARNDAAELAGFQSRIPSYQMAHQLAIMQHTRQAGLGLEMADLAARSWNSGFLNSWYIPYEYHLTRGRPGAAARVLETAIRDTANLFNADFVAVWAALLAHGDTAGAGRAAIRLEARARNEALAPLERGVAICTIENWKLGRGRAETANASIATLRKLVQDTPAFSESLKLCAAAIEAQAAVRARAPNAGQLLARADSISALAPEGAYSPLLQPTNIIVAELYQQLGDDHSALRVLKRRYFAATHESMPTNLLMQARVASRLGDRDAAARAYQHYLVLMDDAEPALHAEREAARRELQQVLADHR